MKIVFGLILIMLLSACGLTNPGQEVCENLILGKLKAPSTYELKNASAFIDISGKKGWVNIEYDADNGFGVPIRDTQICTFYTKDGQWPEKHELELQAIAAGSGMEATCCLKPEDDEALQAVNEATDAADASLEPPKLEKQSNAPPNSPQNQCWQDYCPCENPETALDYTICRNVRGGIEMSDNQWSIGAMARDLKRSGDDSNQQMDEAMRDPSGQQLRSSQKAEISRSPNPPSPTDQEIRESAY